MGKIVTFRGSPPTASGFYPAALAARIARVPSHRLSEWRSHGIILPLVQVTDGLGHESGYTFDALIYLRLLRLLRERRVPMSRAIRVIQHLTDRFGEPGPDWARAKVFVFGRGGDVHVYADDEWDDTVATRGGQRFATALFGTDFLALRDGAEALLVPDTYRKSVQIDPRIRDGRPVVRGTTIPTEVLRRMSANGATESEIREAYPTLTVLQVRQALRYERVLDRESAA